MEAAFVAKRKGHHVILCEQSDALGGLMKLAYFVVFLHLMS